MLVHRHDGADAGRVADDLVVLAVTGRHVHDPGAVLGGHEVRPEDPERVLLVGEEREQRRVAPADELGAEHGGDLLGVAELLGVRRDARRRQDVPACRAVRFGLLQHRVLDVRADGEGEVRRQRPGGGRPGEDPRRRFAVVATWRRIELEPHGHRGILAVAIDVVHPRLGVAQRRLAPPAVGQDLEPLVHQALVPQGLERPHHALHVREVERLVVVLEVHPPGLAGDVALPLVRVAQHAGAAGGVEAVDAELDDRRVAGDAELLLRLDLGRQPVAVPAEAPLHPPAAHRAVARHDVLHVAGEEVPVVREAVGERGAVVEHELVGAVLAGRPGVDRGRERAVLLPELEHLLLELREIGLRIDGRIALRAGHLLLLRRCHGLQGRPVVTGTTDRGTTLVAVHRSEQPLDSASCDGLVPSGSTEPPVRGPPAVLPEARRG